jgi:uncharacterized protein YjiS (DUF1127 family)
MRDYMISEAQSRQAYGRWSWVMRVIKNWRARKSIKLLQSFNEYQLRDIGLTRNDLNRLQSMPLDFDFEWHLERKAPISSKTTEMQSLALSKPERAVSPWFQTKIQRGTLAA